MAISRTNLERFITAVSSQMMMPLRLIREIFNRPAIPFLAYPSTYYTEITSSSYNSIPASFSSNGIIQLKLAKYSLRGQYLGLFDAFDSYIQLCGGGYTTGRPAFTFGTQFNKTVNHCYWLEEIS